MDLPALRRILAEARIRELARIEACTEYDVYEIRKLTREVDCSLRNVEQVIACAFWDKPAASER